MERTEHKELLFESEIILNAVSKSNLKTLIDEYTNQGWTATNEVHNSIEHKYRATMIFVDVWPLPTNYFEDTP